MMKYLKIRLGERTTVVGSVLSFALIGGSFLVPYEYGDVAETMRAVAIPIFIALFLWEDKE